MIGLSVNLISFVPFMRFIPPFSYYHHQYLEAVKDFFGEILRNVKFSFVNPEITISFFFVVWINEIVEEHKRTFDENNFRDFIDAYLDEINKETDSSFTVRLIFLRVFFAFGLLCLIMSKLKLV